MGYSIAAGSVAVREVEFTRLDAGGRSGDWLECAIELEVRRDTQDRSRRDPDFVDDLSVTLMLGVELARGRGEGFEFYRAQADFVALKEGRHFARFYLPPEVVERDQMKQEVHSFLIQLSVAGELVSESVSRQLERPQVRDSFLARVDAESGRNDGVLAPQNQSPFLLSYPRETPSFRDTNRPVLGQ